MSGGGTLRVANEGGWATLREARREGDGTYDASADCIAWAMARASSSGFTPPAPLAASEVDSAASVAASLDGSSFFFAAMVDIIHAQLMNAG